MIAIVAQALLPAPLHHASASTRPRYGGTLHIQMRAAVTAVDPARFPVELAPRVAAEKIAVLLYDRLVAFDERGQLKPQLAVSWESSRDFKRWQFHLRPAVRFTDGTPMDAEAVAAAMQQAGPPGAFNWQVSASTIGDAVTIQTDVPQPRLARMLAHPRHSIVRRAESTLVGTGPFRVAEWPAGGKRIVLAANDDHWGGRPYVDGIEITLEVPPREQMIALELGRADVVDVRPEDMRRVAQIDARVWTSAPAEWIALQTNLGSEGASAVAEVLALAIDKVSIHAVLLQKQGEIANGLLPQWLSGYAFVFRGGQDLEKARQLVAELKSAPGALVLSHDPADQAIAERIALDAREAGITLQLSAERGGTPVRTPDLRLLRLRVESPDPADAIPDFASRIGITEPLGFSAEPSLQELHDREATLVRGRAFIPLFYLPESVGLSLRVKNWMPLRWGEWQLADVWLDQEVGKKEKNRPIGSALGTPQAGATQEKR